MSQIYTLLDENRKPYQSTEKGMFGGHKGRKVYGRMNCRSALQALAKGGYVKGRVFFKDELTAIAAGYRPCAVCMPKEYQLWKLDQSPNNQGVYHD